MNDVNQLIPKGQRKVALGSFVGLVALTAVVCAVELSTRDLDMGEYLLDVGLGALFGGIGGVVFGYIAWLGLSVMRHVIGAVFNDGQTLPAHPNLDAMSGSSKLQADIRERIADRRIRDLTSVPNAGFR
ncbi:MAG TPA: hypothetical protein VFW28_07445 [Micropepsaceae bacterium]|nr:hypothetical protein [Micropepsaceae bacterium]